MDGLEKIRNIIVAALVWTALFLIATKLTNLQIAKSDLWDLRNRIISFIHGLFIFFLSSVSMIQKRDLGSDNDELEDTILCISLGYFIYDMVCMIAVDAYDKFILIHHTLVFAGMGTSLISGRGGVEAILGIFITEISNPIMHIKECLKLLNQTQTALYLLCELSFYGFYFFGRFAIGLPIVYGIVTSWKVHWFERLAAGLLELQSFQWGFTMIQITILRYKQYKERQKNNEALPLFRESLKKTE